MCELILIRGLPGSGKSTFANRLQSLIPYSVHYEADMFFYDEHGNYNYDREKIKEAHAWCLNMAHSGLCDGKTVIVANTFTRRWELRQYYNMVHRSWNGVQITEIICNNNGQNTHGVPSEHIEAMRKRWEM